MKIGWKKWRIVWPSSDRSWNQFGSRIDRLDRLDIERLNSAIERLSIVKESLLTLVRRLEVESLNSTPFAPISEKGTRDRRPSELEALEAERER